MPAAASPAHGPGAAGHPRHGENGSEISILGLALDCAAACGHRWGIRALGGRVWGTGDDPDYQPHSQTRRVQLVGRSNGDPSGGPYNCCSHLRTGETPAFGEGDMPPLLESSLPDAPHHWSAVCMRKPDLTVSRIPPLQGLTLRPERPVCKGQEALTLPVSSHPFLRTAERRVDFLRPVFPMADSDTSAQRWWLLAPASRWQSYSQCLAGPPQPLTAPGLPPAPPHSAPGDISKRPGLLPALSKPSMAPHCPRSPVFLSMGCSPSSHLPCSWGYTPPPPPCSCPTPTSLCRPQQSQTTAQVPPL